MNFLKVSLLSGINTVVTMTLGLFTNKFIAVFIGAEGFALVGQVKDFLKIGLSLGQFGFDKGIVRYVSEHSESPERLSRFISTIFKLQLMLSIALAIVILIFYESIFQYLTGFENLSRYFILIGISLLPMVLYTSGMSVLNGLKAIKKFTVITITANILSSLLGLYLIYNYKLKGVLLYLALAQFISLFIFFIFVFKKPFKAYWFKDKIRKVEFTQLTKFSMMSIVGTLSLAITLIATRKYLNLFLGIEYTGYWEALWRLSVVFVSVLTSAFGFYLLPTFSKLNTRHLKKEIFNIWKITIPISLAAGILIILGREFLISLVYSEEFLIISTMLIFQIIGDIIKINSWILGNLILAKVHVKTYIIVQVGWSVVFFCLSLIFTQKFGFKGMAIAYLVSYIIHFLFMNIYFKKLLWRRHVSI